MENFCAADIERSAVSKGLGNRLVKVDNNISIRAKVKFDPD